MKGGKQKAVKRLHRKAGIHCSKELGLGSFRSGVQESTCSFSFWIFSIKTLELGEKFSFSSRTLYRGDVCY